MRLSPEAIQEFKAIYREEFGENLTDAESEEMAQRVLRLFWTLLQQPSEVSRSLSEQ